jgi:hypothetical protein
MKKDKLTMRAEVENALQDKPLTEVNFSIRMQKFILFLYTESTIFYTFLLIFMGSFIWRLCTEGPSKGVLFLGVIEALLYLPFYHYVVKNIRPFKKRAEEYSEIKDRLEVLLDYRDYRLSQ